MTDMAPIRTFLSRNTTLSTEDRNCRVWSTAALTTWQSLTVKILLRLLILTALIAASGSQALAQTANITTTADVESVDGVCSIREAWNETDPVACGTAPLSEMLLPAGVYALNSPLGNTTNATMLMRGAGASTTILNLPVAGGRAFTIVNRSLGLEDLTLQGGSEAFGGGQLVGAGAATIVEANRVIFANGTSPGVAFPASQGGGCINTDGGALRIYNSVLLGCTTLKNGGALQTDGTAVLLVNTTVVDNSAAAGSAVDVANGPVQITNGVFWNNGGTPFSGVAPTLTNTDITQTVNPRFVTDFTDLRLGDASSFINNGSATAGVSPTFSFAFAATDLAGLSRAQGTIDLGAHERNISRDLADAPDAAGSYPTLLANSGPGHLLPSGSFLGAVAGEDDPDGQPSADAGRAGGDGDDGDGTDEEDGRQYN